MLPTNLFSKLVISPRVSFWISVFCLIFTLVNNHIYLAGLNEREKRVDLQMKENLLREQSLAKQERLLRTWESEMIAREAEFKMMMQESRKARAIQ